MEDFNMASYVQQQQQYFAEPINEGDLTDEYVVNLMDEFGISFNTSLDYQASKLYDEHVQDVMNIPQVTYNHEVPNYETISPVMALNCESSEQSSSSPVCSPYFINMAEPNQVNNSPAILENSQESWYTSSSPESNQMTNSPVLLASPQESWYTSSSPESSPCTITSAGSPAGFFGDAAGLRSISPAMPTDFESSIFGDAAVPTDFESSGNTLSVPLSSTMPMAPQSPTGVSAEPPVALSKKRRGRKPKSAAEKANSSRLQTKSKRTKIYEIDSPFEDKEMERKRLNAVNARRHRLLQKETLENMEKQLADCTIEKIMLFHEKEEMQKNVATLTKQLESFQNYFGMQSVPVVTFFPKGQK